MSPTKDPPRYDAAGSGASAGARALLEVSRAEVPDAEQNRAPGAAAAGRLAVRRRRARAAAGAVEHAAARRACGGFDCSERADRGDAGCRRAHGRLVARGREPPSAARHAARRGRLPHRKCREIAAQRRRLSTLRLR